MARAIGKAERRAYLLLRQYLSPHQARTYYRHKFFWVRGADKDLYALVRRDRVVSLDRRYDAVTVYHLWAESEECFALPSSDTKLAQLLLLQTNPGDLFDIACATAASEYSEWDALDPVRARACLPGFLAEEQRNGTAPANVPPIPRRTRLSLRPVRRPQRAYPPSVYVSFNVGPPLQAVRIDAEFLTDEPG